MEEQHRNRDYATSPSQDAEVVPFEHLHPYEYLSNMEAVPNGFDQCPEMIHEKDNDVPSRSSSSSGNPKAQTTPARTGRKIYGYRAHHVVAFAMLIALVILGAVLGGVFGSRIANNQDKKKPASTSIISDISRLSASNWTSTDGTQHRTVYFQDRNDHLLARRWDSRDRIWRTTDMTEKAQLKGGDSAPIPGQGTTIASVASDFDPDIRSETIFFLTRDSIIRSYWLPDAEKSPEAWETEGMMGWTNQVLPGSDLAATYKYNNGTEEVLLAYQQTGHNVWIGNSLDWNNAPKYNDPALLREYIISEQTPLAMSPFWGGVPDGAAMAWESFDQHAQFQMNLKGSNNSELRWVNFERSWLLSDIETTSLLNQHFAVTKMNYMQSTMWFSRTKDGTIRANWQVDGNPWNEADTLTDDGEQLTLEFEDYDAGGGTTGAPQWGSIAAAHGGLFYGIEGGGERILEYQVDMDDPKRLKFSQVVYPDGEEAHT